MKVRDLIAPTEYEYGSGPNMVRFCWALGDDGPGHGTILVIDKDGRNAVSVDDARALWRRLRKAGWTVKMYGWKK